MRVAAGREMTVKNDLRKRLVAVEEHTKIAPSPLKMTS